MILDTPAGRFPGWFFFFFGGIHFYRLFTDSFKWNSASVPFMLLIGQKSETTEAFAFPLILD